MVRAPVGGVLIAVLIAVAETRVVTRCELARELIRQRVPRSLVSNWVCLVENESRGDTSIRIGPNKDGSFDLGIFKINSKWCRNGYQGGECKLRCEVLTDNTLADDIACAKKVYDRGGFAYWSGWTAKCKGKSLPNVSECYHG